MRYVRLVAVAIAAVMLLVPASAQAATCSDYSNQAAAQRAADTRDGDGDGVYCEALPCPCLKPGQSSGGGSASKPKSSKSRRARRYVGRISRVVDGDTVNVRINGGRFERVRLIGLDSPETKKPGVAVECGGLEATALMKRLAFSSSGKGRSVVLKTDPTQDTRDRYKRLLAYVTTRSPVAGRPRNLALELIRAGWARRYVYRTRFQRYSTFTRAQSRARSAKRGVWGSCRGDFHSEQ